MSVFRRGSVWMAEIKISRKGATPFRATATFDNKAAALAWEKEQKQAAHEALRAGRIPPPPTTLRDALTQFWKEATASAQADAAAGKERDEVKLRPSLRFIKTNTSKIKAWQNNPLAPLRLSSITRAHLNSWIDERRDAGKAEATIRNDLNILRYLLDWADQKWNWNIPNTAREALRNVGHSRQRDRRPSADETTRLLAVFAEMRQQQLPHRHESSRGQLGQRITISAVGATLEAHPHNALLYMHAAYQAAIECAMRRSALFSACWSWVDWENRFLVVPLEHQGPSNKKVPKAIPVSPALLDILRDLYQQRVPQDDNGKIFGELTGDEAYELLQDACKVLKIDDLRWHDLRHEACSRLAEKGWTIQEIQAVSGHKTLQALERYMHVRPETIRDKMEREAAAPRPEPTPPQPKPASEVRRGHLCLVA